MLSSIASLSTKQSTECMHVLSDRFMSMIGNNVILEMSELGLVLYSLVVKTPVPRPKPIPAPSIPRPVLQNR